MELQQAEEQAQRKSTAHGGAKFANRKILFHQDGKQGFFNEYVVSDRFSAEDTVTMYVKGKEKIDYS
ncbi:hypothetical protein [Flavobacterium sp.]|uniref:hypothetical protein n=1 Tax=Flavobacterium sp. TaxID=239 RepID=UPI00261AF901|nr:hypothetical protein [Flavobacterium sp.]